MLLLRGVTTSYQVSESRQKYISNHMVGGTLEYIEYRSQFLIIVVNLQPLEIISGGFLLQKWGLKMKKIFIAIVVCMICNVGWGVNWICEIDQCDKGTWALDDNPYNNPCMVCPANTYQDGCINPGEECTPCPAGTGTIGDTAAHHDSIDDCIPMETEEISCNSGYYLPANSQSCTQCPKNSYCPGGTFTPTTADSGITQCPDNMYSPLGSDSADDCGRVLHIGEYILYLRTAKLTVPSLNVQIGNTIYYGDMFPA